MNSLDHWLEHCERLHPHNIEMGLDRVRTVVERMALHFDCPVITVAGTKTFDVSGLSSTFVRLAI